MALKKPVMGKPGQVKLVSDVGNKTMIRKPEPPVETLQTPANPEEENGKKKQFGVVLGANDQKVLDMISSQHDGDKSAAIRAAIRHYAFACSGRNAWITVTDAGHNDGIDLSLHHIKRNGMLC